MYQKFDTIHFLWDENESLLKALWDSRLCGIKQQSLKLQELRVKLCDYKITVYGTKDAMLGNKLLLKCGYR